ncbi:MAG TPA: DUF4249 domain-containing protein [Bacteroidales bacterium]|nr:DUF4249 domain-containing protein [Bacteroidales bacterium]HOM40609.1 DUF4249 domain-containing protein [Bacteroidales bacterium]HRU56998.1 DUF4249 domain-containing protein [Bacteroidales bacterium]
MNNWVKFILIFLFLLVPASGCIEEFIPDVEETKEMIVVEGLVTDQNRTNKVKISKSLPIGRALARKPVRAAKVTIIDDLGFVTTLKETDPGIYSTDSTSFRGVVGRKYALRIESSGFIYETDYIEMKPVPPIDSLYWEKILITQSDNPAEIEEGCKIYLDTHDPNRKCFYFRWEYEETWEFWLPYQVPNNRCWVTEKSDRIMIKNASIYNQPKVTKFPVTFITNETDRLKVRYSILVKQYSLNADEYKFWEKIQNVSENVGSLYDVIPMAIKGNIRCTNKPSETVLGYFSVSAVTEKRIFIKDWFKGIPNFYWYCPTDTIFGRLPEEGRNVTWWVIEDGSSYRPPYWVTTIHRECADCTTRGTNIKPSFWP